MVELMPQSKTRRIHGGLVLDPESTVNMSYHDLVKSWLAQDYPFLHLGYNGDRKTLEIHRANHDVVCSFIVNDFKAIKKHPDGTVCVPRIIQMVEEKIVDALKTE